MQNLKPLTVSVSFFALSCERIFIETQALKADVIEVENTLFAGAFVHLSARKFYWLGQWRGQNPVTSLTCCQVEASSETLVLVLFLCRDKLSAIFFLQLCDVLHSCQNITAHLLMINLYVIYMASVNASTPQSLNTSILIVWFQRYWCCWG